MPASPSSLISRRSGPRTRPGPLPLFDVHGVPHRPRGRVEPGTTPASDTSTADTSRAGRDRPRSGVVRDITALRGPAKGVWYKCYVIIDVFSRYVTGWLVAAAEDAVVAHDFLAGAVARNGIEPQTIHADRGGAMISRPVSENARRSRRPTLAFTTPDLEQPILRSPVQNQEIRAGPPGTLRIPRRRPRLLRRLFHRLQPRTPPLRDRLAPPGISALRHRRPNPRTARQNTLDAAHVAHPDRFNRRPHAPHDPAVGSKPGRCATPEPIGSATGRRRPMCARRTDTPLLIGQATGSAGAIRPDWRRASVIVSFKR